MKLVAIAAALENEIISSHETVNCKGSYLFGDRLFHCWNREGHGEYHRHFLSSFEFELQSNETPVI